MSNSSENEIIGSDNEKVEWVTPQQAADLLAVNYRYVYRLIESGELVSDGKKHGQKVSSQSVETARIKRLLSANTDMNFTDEIANSDEVQQGSGQVGLTKRENNQMGAIALQGIQGERDKLLELYNEVQGNWRSDLADLQDRWREDVGRIQDERRKEAVESAIKVSQLTEQVKNLEAQLKAAQTQPAVTPAAAEPAPPAPRTRRRWWQITD